MAVLTLNTIKAFPTAQGHGKNSVGGRNGDVYEVTTLSNSATTPGSLKYGIDNAPVQGRTIVFKVSGWIDQADGIGGALTCSNSNITIAGQTSPMGIGIAGELRLQAFNDPTNNITIRHLHARSNNSGVGSSARAAIRIVSYLDNLISNIITDHCSFGWASDENVTITEACSFCDDGGGGVNNVTIQNCIVDNNIGPGSALQPNRVDDRVEKRTKENIDRSRQV